MFSKTQLAALKKFKACESDLQTFYLDDKAVKKICASWSFISRKITAIKTKAPEGQNQCWSWLWQAIQLDLAELAYVTGSRDRCIAALAIARSNHLIYPDGTLNNFVLQALQPVQLDIIGAIKKKKAKQSGAWKPEAIYKSKKKKKGNEEKISIDKIINELPLT